MNNIVLFDGDCNFCDQSVQFIIKRDHAAYYKFASLQSKIGKDLLKQYNISKNTDSFILIANSTMHSKSSAALRVCRNLTGLWKVFYALLIIPKPIRDLLYDIIAKNRYKWFGKKTSCPLPTPATKGRFL